MEPNTQFSFAKTSREAPQQLCEALPRKTKSFCSASNDLATAIGLMGPFVAVIVDDSVDECRGAAYDAVTRGATSARICV